MKNRIPTKPNRYAVYDDAHNFLRHEYHERADEPTEVGTPINKATLLSDETAAKYPQGTDTVDKVLKHLSSGVIQTSGSNAFLNLLGSKVQIPVEQLDNKPWESLATLKTVVGSYEGSGASGPSTPNTIVFGNMKPKCVIVVGLGYYKAEDAWVAMPFLLCMPYADKVNWNYDVAYTSLSAGDYLNRNMLHAPVECHCIIATWDTDRVSWFSNYGTYAQGSFSSSGNFKYGYIVLGE